MSRSPHTRLTAAGVSAALIATTLLAAAPAGASTSTRSRHASATGVVTRHGSELYLHGKRWRFTGVNMYWLGLDENVTDAKGPTYPTHTAVDSGFRAAADLGAQLVRSTTLGVSVGSPRSLEPRLGHFNNKAFAAIDYAVAEARRYGMHLMIPLTDEWHFYEGGKHTFTNWFGRRDVPGQNCVTSSVQRRNEAHFYTGPRIIRAFHRYVRHLLDHVDPLTGLRLGGDPTIAVWETGNELWDAPPAWTEQTAKFIKSLAPRALVADGSAASGKDITQTGVDEPDVDIEDGHFYPTDTSKARQDSAYTASRGKAYMVGEYPLTGSGVGRWLSALARDTAISGGLAWSLFPRVHGVPEQHDDGFTFHYPGADPAEVRMDAVQSGYARQLRRVDHSG